jgi:transcriptional regulator with GAF, ATPase, and Fis domain
MSDSPNLIEDEQYSLFELAEIFAEIGGTLSRHADPDAVFAAVVELAIAQVPGAEYAGITVGADDQFRTRSASDEIVRRTDRIQYELRSGPCISAAVNEAIYNAPDLDSDTRWPEFGHRAAREVGVRSMYAVRLFVDDDDVVAALNLYSTDTDAFGPASEAIALLLATHGAAALATANSREKVANLMNALESNREIGVAMGIVMQQHKVTRDQAFNLLRLLSQHLHRKVADIAAEIAETGLLPALPSARARRPAAQ